MGPWPTRGKDRRRQEECEEAAANATVIASVALDQHTFAPINKRSGTSARDRITRDATDAGCDSRSKNLRGYVVCRIWGLRPFQFCSDNNAAAQKYWSGLSAVKMKNNNQPVLSNSGTVALTDLKQLSPGHGPGVPWHLPVSYEGFDGNAITKIACGDTCIYFLTSVGDLYVIGHGLRGELGLGSKVGSVREPTKIVISVQQAPIDAVHTISIRTSSTANLTEALENDTRILIKDIAAGSTHGVALTSKGSIYVWGASEECGMLTTRDLTTPVLLNDMINSSWLSVGRSNKFVAIDSHKTASAILASDGSLYLFGGWSGTAPILSPWEVARLSGEATSVQDAQIALGDSMGILRISAKHDIQKNHVFQLGHGARNEILFVDVDPSDDLNFEGVAEHRYSHLVPQPITSHLTKTTGVDCFDCVSVVAGNNHVILLTRAGQAISWGDNTWGQCGVSGERVTHVASPACICHNENLRVKEVFAGGSHSAALTNSGAVYVWGCSRDHRLGNSTIKMAAEAPLKALSQDGFLASLGRASTLGTSTQSSVQDSVFVPERMLLVTPFLVSTIGLGQTYTVIATQD